MSKEVMQMALDVLIPAVDGKVYTSWAGHGWAAIEALRAALAQPEPKPVAYLNVDEDGDVKSMEWGPDMLPGVHALYLAPPRREWVGLTDEEYEAMAEQCVTNCYFDTLEYAKSIEAKLKEKNT